MKKVIFISLVLFIWLLIGVNSVSAQQVCVDDVQGANDVNQAQTDVTQLCVDQSGLPATYEVTMSWDEIRLSGNNTGDACLLFDTDGNGNINNALCLQVKGNPLLINDGPSLFSCTDTKNDRCTGPTPITLTAGSLTSCTVNQQNTDPFPSGSNFQQDTVGICTIDTHDISLALQVNVCSYPSQNPNSDPKDCVGILGGGFIFIIKDADPDDTTQFNFTVTDAGGNPTAVSIIGSGSKGISLNLGTYSLNETIPAGWGITSSSCNDGSSTGTNPITGITVGSGQTVTCTVSNRRQADLVISKDDGIGTYTPGGNAIYVITVTNNGPASVSGATIQDLLLNGITLSAQWTCSASAGSSCSSPSGGSVGDSSVSLTADILNGGIITVNVPVQFSANMGDY